MRQLYLHRRELKFRSIFKRRQLYVLNTARLVCCQDSRTESLDIGIRFISHLLLDALSPRRLPPMSLSNPTVIVSTSDRNSLHYCLFFCLWAEMPMDYGFLLPSSPAGLCWRKRFCFASLNVTANFVKLSKETKFQQYLKIFDLVGSRDVSESSL